jgi:hypothetical protein
MDTVIRGAEPRQILNTLLYITNQHPHAQDRSSLLAQLICARNYNLGPPIPEEIPPTTLDILRHLPDKDEGRLSLNDALICLYALPSTPNNFFRDYNVQAAAERIVESTVPLLADEADGMQAWIRSNLSQLTNVDELTRLVPRQEAQ